MIALDRLRQVSGLNSGSTGAALRNLAGTSGASGVLLAGWSVLPIGTAAQHLLSGSGQSQQVTRDPYRDIAANVFNLRVDGPGNAIYIRIAQRHPRRR